MLELTLKIEVATPEAIAPYGHFVGARDGAAKFLSWPSGDVYGAIPITVGDGGELLLARMAAKQFPVQVGIIERHFKHTQTYLPFNGKPFVMVLGLESNGNLPDYTKLRAFLFQDASGIVMNTGVWHEFPHALEDDTQFAVILRAEAHVNTLKEPEYPHDAEGPDLERRVTKPRATIWVSH